MKRLYDENDKYTVDAEQLGAEANKVLRPIVLRYAEKGFSIRDIQGVLCGEVFDLVLTVMLGDVWHFFSAKNAVEK